MPDIPVDPAFIDILDADQRAALERGEQIMVTAEQHLQIQNAQRANADMAASEHVAAGRFESALAAAGRNDGPRLLDRWVREGLITHDRLRSLLPTVWQMAEFPEQVLGAKRWVSLFRSAGFVSDDASVQTPKQVIEIYRGAPWSRRRGMSWTTDLKRAEWFAARYTLASDAESVAHRALNYEADQLGVPWPGAEPGVLLRARIDPDNVLAILLGRSEAEVVVDPSGLPRLAKPAPQ